MRIAYVTEWNPYDPTGVLRKILGQVSAWKAAGASVHIFALAPLRNIGPALDFDSHGEIVGKISQQTLTRFSFARLGYVNKIWSAGELKAAVENFSPDMIYYRRQGPWYPGIGSVLRLAPTVAEVNGNTAGAAIWGKLNERSEIWSNWILQRSISAYVAVSPEIAEEFRDTGAPVAVIPNSLPQKPRPLPPTDNERPAFVFVGSALAQGGGWHGIDKILTLASRLPLSRFEIVGLTSADLAEPVVPKNVRFHGPKYGKDLEAIYRSCDVGIGTLALHRRGMEITSALKPLEYLIFGLPVILGYRETEPALNSGEYTLSIGNHEKNVLDNIDAIAAFAETWRARRVSADLTYLSSDVVERKRLDFLGALAAPREDGSRQRILPKGG
jgi:glycosyltransferase involved in cell wall biosynthesis